MHIFVTVHRKMSCQFAFNIFNFGFCLLKASGRSGEGTGLFTLPTVSRSNSPQLLIWFQQARTSCHNTVSFWLLSFSTCFSIFFVGRLTSICIAIYHWSSIHHNFLLKYINTYSLPLNQLFIFVCLDQVKFQSKFHSDQRINCYIDVCGYVQIHLCMLTLNGSWSFCPNTILTRSYHFISWVKSSQIWPFHPR